MRRHRLLAAFPVLAFALFASAAAQAQADLSQAQQTYEDTLASCNSGVYPTPERNACVRDAGAALDRARGVQATDTEVQSNDERATIVTPVGTPAPTGGDDTVTSRDGRAIIVLPADGQR